MVRLEEMRQFGIIRVDQGVYLSGAECFQMVHILLKQLLADTLMLVIGINADGIQGCFPGKFRIRL